MERFRKYFLLLTGYILGSTLMVSGQVIGKKVLDDYVTFASRSSPLMKDYNNQLLMNQIDSMRLKAGYKPQLIASSTGMYAPVIKGYGFDEVLTNGHTLDALLTLNYAITGKDVKDNQYHNLSLQRDSIQYAVKLSQLDLKKAITDQYINAFASQQQMVFNTEICNLLEKEEAVLKKLTRSNVYGQAEYLTFLVACKQQQLALKQAQLQFKNDLYTLNYSSGIVDTAIVILVEPILETDNGLKPDKSFFVKRFEIDSLKALNERKSVDFNYRPKASIYVNSGYNSSLLLQPYKNFGSSAGFTISMPIYDGHQRKMQYSKFNLQGQTVSAYKAFFSTQQKQQFSLIQQQLDAIEGLYRQINEQIKYTRALIEVDSKLLHTGDLKITDFVVAINNYMSAQNLYRQTSINRLKLISQLNYWKR